MSDDDDYPNFGNAWTSAAPPITTPSQLSSPPPQGEGAWNPAHRPDSHTRPARTTSSLFDGDSFDRYTEHTPEKQTQPFQQRIGDVEENDNVDLPSKLLNAQPVVLLADTDGRDALLYSTREREFDSDEEQNAAIEDIIHSPDDYDEEAAIFDPHADARTQELALEVPPSEPPYFIGTPGMETPMAHDEAFERELGRIHSQQPPELGYEHQGEETEMEQAVDEAPSAPLLDDVEEPPTVDDASLLRQSTISRVQENDAVESFGLGQPMSKASAVPAHLGRAFTTNFTDLPSPVAVEKERLQEEQQPPVDAGWPAAGDDKTFGELLGDEQATAVQDRFARDLPPSVQSKQSVEDVWGAETNEDDNDNDSGFLAEQETAVSEQEEQPIPKFKGNARKHTWGGVASDDTFGDLLDPQAISTQPEPSTVDPTAVAEEPRAINAPIAPPTGQEEDDLAAMFAAALQDDDLLDEGTDPSKFFGDDDGGFLDDDLLPEDPVPMPAPAVQSAQAPSGQTQRTASPYVPAAAQQTTQSAFQSNPYAAPGPQIVNQNHGRSVGTPQTGLFDVYNQGAPVQQQQQPQRPSAQSAQSFVDKAKGGYQSPYDLPMEVVKTRQRPRQPAPVSSAPGQPTPPPRTTSMSSHTAQPALARALAAEFPDAGLTPPSSSGSVPGPPPSTAMSGAAAVKQTPRSSLGFFVEELPVAPKLRARPSAAYMPQAQVAPTPPPGPMTNQPRRRDPTDPSIQAQQRSQTQTAQQSSSYGGLAQPERMPLLPDEPTAPATLQPGSGSGPVPNSRYSPSTLPAPSQNQSRFSPAPPPQGPSGNASRYSPAPAAQSTAKRYGTAPAAAPASHPLQNAHAFAPRTSSPLAFHDKSLPSSPPKSNGSRRGSPGVMSPERSVGHYSPGEPRASSLASLASPPQRTATRSPPATMKTPKYTFPKQTIPEQPPSGAGLSQITSAPQQNRSIFLPHRRRFSRDITYVPPSDEHAQDPLMRWQGCPVFHQLDSGIVVRSFSSQTPFYAAGQTGPTMKITPGAIKFEQATAFMPMDEVNAKFPGPLATKAKKKKEVLSWMLGKIENLEHRAQAVKMDFSLEPDLKKRAAEKLVLWRVMKVFVEHDGKLEGDKKIEEELRAILLPNLAQMGQIMELQSPISTSGGSLQADTVDKIVVVQLRQALLEGQRERAVWLAEEKKLWGHAMLIASTMGPETWRQIIGSFVRSQVKTVGSDARSLAALYQVFAGNAEEVADELVPPSARAGFQMMSKTEGAVASNPLEGLDQWQETLGLIAGNRTPTDGHSLLSLGKLLAGYNRAEAAHTCFIFARLFAKHTGADDADATFTLLGSNKEELGMDLDCIILTEIFEWASSLSQQRPDYIPHLQSYKLVHAQELAGAGLKSKASYYCDHISRAYQSTTKPSPYYHPTFTQAVSDLSAFLSQSPQTDGQSLLSKGAMNKVSSKTASWFTKFVSGDEDQDSNASGPGSEVFGHVNRESPVISRRGSSDGLYGAMIGTGSASPYSKSVSSPPQHIQPSSASARYGPNASGGKYNPTASGVVAMPAGDPQRPSSERRYAPAPSPQPLGVPRPDLSRAASDFGTAYMSSSRRGSGQFSSGSYDPKPLLAEQPASYGYQPMSSSHSESAHAVQAPSRPDSSIGSVNGMPAYEEPVLDPEGGNYGPPTRGGYEPPNYQPYEPEPGLDDDEPRPKKKSFMDDDDDDFLARAAAIKGAPPVAPTTHAPSASQSMSKAEADRMADEAFRQAAEADAARDKEKAAAPKKGWGLGGWFGGKKPEDQSSSPSPQTNKPIKAKLGDENSFYFDKDLGKWINKKDPQSAQTAAAATPPPPKGSSSRGPSGVMGPPSGGPPSRVASGANLPPMSMGSSPRIGSGNLGPPSGPPSRMATPAGNSDVGPGQSLVNPAVAALNGGSLSSRPPSRPSTGMSTASSLDDLLGEPTQRKAGGTVKGKKKGGRYVDVMGTK